MSDDQPDSPPAVTWVVELDVEAVVELPGGAVVDRETFLGWLWEVAADVGLVGVSEGSIDVTEAVALGLIDAPLVLDAAAAPAGRDWVGRLPRCRVTCGFDSQPALRACVARLAAVRGCRVVAERAEAMAGEAAWRSMFGPVAVPGFGMVLPAWEPGTAGGGAGETTIFIEPGIGFGTGLHETTQLCLAALAARRRDGGRMNRVLDFGSGSGILGIAAAVLGAGVVDAVEIDSTCHAAIRANAARNGVADRIRVAASLPTDAAGCDVVVANIVAPVLLEEAAALCGCRHRETAARPPGSVILSGLRDDDMDRVAVRYTDLLGTAPARTSRGGWHCLRFG